MGILKKKIFQGRTRPFRLRSLHTPGTPLRGLISLSIKHNAVQYGRLPFRYAEIWLNFNALHLKVTFEKLVMLKIKHIQPLNRSPLILKKCLVFFLFFAVTLDTCKYS